MNRETVAGTASVSQLCAAFGVSRAAYYAAKAPRREPKQRGNVVKLPRRPKHTSAEVVLDAIKRVIAEEPAWGVRKVWATLKRDEFKVSRRRVWALMHANGLVLARDREPGDVTRGHVTVPEPNRRFAADLTTVWTKQDGLVGVTLGVDCGCRSLLGLVVDKDQSSAAILAAIDQALEAAFSSPGYVPDGVELRTDHGPQFTGADCEALATRWGVAHTFAPVGRPTGNAVVERLIRTMKEEVVWLRDWNSADELRQALLAWMKRYNERRPHQALGWKTPAEFRAARLSREPDAIAA